MDDIIATLNKAIPLLGLAGTGVAGAYALWERRERFRAQAQRDQLEWEIKIRKHVPDYITTREQNTRLDHDIHQLLDNTEFDRYIEFRTVNGNADPMLTSQFVEIRKGGQRRFDFYDVETDEHYRGMLHRILAGEIVYYVTADLPTGCLLAKIYKAEEVTAALVFHVATFVLDADKGIVLHVYLSLATHAPGLITETGRLEAELMVDKIRAFAATFQPPK